MAQQLPLIDPVALATDAPDTDTDTGTDTGTAAPEAPPAAVRRRRPSQGGRRHTAARGPRTLAVVADRRDVVIEIDGADWRIDDRTKELGLAGVAAAREALAAAIGHSAA
jgi:hypothetical protein